MSRIFTKLIPQARKGPKMATKQQVIRRANKLGATVEINGYEVVVSMPAGMVMDHLHYSAYEFAAFEYKSDIWQQLLDELKLARACNCGCAAWE
jgi:hypothetical protein